MYDSGNLLIQKHDCSKTTHIWLLLVHLTILIMKILLFLIDNLNREPDNYIKTKKIIAFIIYIILFPFLIILNIVGSIWFAKIEKEKDTECVYFFLLK